MPPPPHEWGASSSTESSSSHQLWPESLDTPGYIPQHLKRRVTDQFPILELIQRLLYRLKPNGTSEVEKVLALVGLYQAIRPIYRNLKAFCIWVFTVQITIQEADPLAKEVLAWIGSEVITKAHSRSAMLITSGIQDFSNTYTCGMMPPPLGVTKSETDEGVFSLPPVGTRLFWIGFRPFIFSRRGNHSSNSSSFATANVFDESGRLPNEITLMTLGWSLKPLQNFAKMCHDFKAKHITRTTTVYFAGSRHDPYGNGWQSVSKAVRKLDTIDIDEDTKADIVRDAEYYYSDESRTYFAECGIPYRRGYLFYGPPGTGKSSFSAALAGHLRCDIYHVSLASGTITDADLHRLFLGLPRKCIVVIEDIDCAGISRERVDLQGAAHVSGIMAFEGVPQIPYETPTSRHTSVTLSGLLNAIDGNTSQEGRLLIMTSNDPDALDAALTRPGRIDKKVYFGNMNRSAGKSIFKRLIGRSALASKSAFTTAQIDQWADKFAEQVPPNTFSPAEIQNFLQDCRGDPMKALNDIGAWVANHRPVRTSESSASELDYIPSDSDEGKK